MNIRRSILNFILVRESESKLVQLLFIFEFFQGSAIALFFTSAISIFLLHTSAINIPQVYILSAFLLWITGLLYHKLEHSLSLKKLIYLIVIFNTVFILLFRLLYHFYNLDTWYLYLVLGVFNVLYLLNNLEFWGLAAQIFDVRQSKRLFGVISSGDIPAKMVGYFSAYLISPFIGTENLLFVAAALSFTALLFLNSLFKNIYQNNPQVHSKKAHATHSVKNIQAALSGDRLIRKIAIISFFSFSIFLIANFIFYGYVKSAFKTDQSLVSFFAVFFGITRLVTLILKIFIANKLVDLIGLRNALMVSPIILFIISFSGVFLINQFDLQHFSFYFFGVLIVIIDVLRSAIQTPVLLATLQPLPVQQRLKGHTIIKGLMDPFAFLLVGVFLYFSIDVNNLNFEYLNYCIILLILAWAYFNWSVEKDYLNTLHTAIRNRSFTSRDIEISDKDTLNFLLDKVTKGNETEAISVLKLLSGQAIDKTSFYEAGLNHYSEHVQTLTLEIIQQDAEISMLPLLKAYLYDETKANLTAKLILVISSLDKDFEMSAFMHHSNPNVVFNATLSTLPDLIKKNPEEAESILYNQLHFSSKKNKINALKIIGNLKIVKFEYKVVEMMFHSDEEIKYAARMAGAGLATMPIIHKLLDDYVHEKKDNDIIEALGLIGNDIIEHVIPLIIRAECHGAKSRKLITLLGKINTNSSLIFLEGVLKKYPENVDAILSSLHQISVTRNKDKNYEEINKLLRIAVLILFKIKFTQQTNVIVSKALVLELNIIRDKCLYWFSTFIDKDTIQKIKTGLMLNTKDTNANALELIQMEINNEVTALFALIYENSSVEDKCLQLEINYKYRIISEDTLVKNTLFDVNYCYSNWLKACVLYTIKGKNNLLSNEFIKPFTESKSELIKNTAAYLMADE